MIRPSSGVLGTFSDVLHVNSLALQSPFDSHVFASELCRLGLVIQLVNQFVCWIEEDILAAHLDAILGTHLLGHGIIGILVSHPFLLHHLCMRAVHGALTVHDLACEGFGVRVLSSSETENRNQRNRCQRDRYAFHATPRNRDGFALRFLILQVCTIQVETRFELADKMRREAEGYRSAEIIQSATVTVNPASVDEPTFPLFETAASPISLAP